MLHCVILISQLEKRVLQFIQCHRASQRGAVVRTRLSDGKPTPPPQDHRHPTILSESQ